MENRRFFNEEAPPAVIISFIPEKNHSNFFDAMIIIRYDPKGECRHMMNRKNRTENNIFRKTGVLLLLVLLFLCPFCRQAEAVGLDRLEIPEEPETEAWYRITPEGAVSADGSPWHGMFKKGTEENKVLVWFYGGGVSINEEMASRPGTFYTSRLRHDGDERKGIGSGNPLNPFRTWTVLELPYSTADFHLGTGEFTWSSANGEEKTIFHHGYRNFRDYMEKAVQYLDHPDTVIIAGCSAGGFGAAMLADEILTDYFPEAENTTVLIESSLLLRDAVLMPDILCAGNHWLTCRKLPGSPE